MKELVIKLQKDLVDECICQNDFIVVLKQLCQSPIERYSEFTKLAGDYIRTRNGKSFKKLLSSNTIFEYLLQSNMDLRVFAYCTAVHFKYNFKTKYRFDLPVISSIMEEDSQDVFNNILYSIINTEVIK